MNKKILLILGFVLCIGIASAAMFQYYTQLNGHVYVPGLTVTDSSGNDISGVPSELSLYKPTGYSDFITLHHSGATPIMVNFATAVTLPGFSDDFEGVGLNISVLPNTGGIESGNYLVQPGDTRVDITLELSEYVVPGDYNVCISVEGA